MSNNYLVLTDVDAIQRYVFASIRMATIVGASEIVASFDRQLEADAKMDFQASLAVLSGGNGLFVFSGRDKAGDFASHAVSGFRNASVNGTLTASSVEAFASNPQYLEALKRALASLESGKRRGTATEEPLNLGLAWQCEYCGAEPAGPTPVPIADETRRIGRACAKKLKARDTVRQDVARDFNELAGEDYLAVIVIDGDGLGQRLQGQSNPCDYETFSSKVKGCIAKAIEAGISVCESGTVETLYRGGDDIVVACPSQGAFPFVEAFSKSLEEQDWQWAGGKKERIGFSIGMAITHSGFPFRVAHQISNRLLRNAKNVAKEQGWTEGGIDFAIVTEAFGDADVILRERQVGDADNRILLSGRPYRLKLGEARSLSHLREACTHLKDFPRNRLYSLRNELSHSQLAGGEETSSISTAVARDKLKRLLSNWQERVDRVGPLKDAWEAAARYLPVGNDIYPCGDLADALYLWEKCLGSQNSTHD